MKQYLLSIILTCTCPFLFAQPDLQRYPDPEFNKEVYYLKKDSSSSLVRLEKASSKMESKTKMGGFGGYESGYEFEGSKSTARLPYSRTLSFVYSTGATAKASSPERDSLLQANGIDPSMMNGIGNGMDGMTDPSSSITLFKVESGKGKRKIMMQKAGGAFGGKKMQSSDKYTFSVKKVREGYWELVVDKTLPKGEYAFQVYNTAMGNADGSGILFSFGID